MLKTFDEVFFLESYPSHKQILSALSEASHLRICCVSEIWHCVLLEPKKNCQQNFIFLPAISNGKIKDFFRFSRWPS